MAITDFTIIRRSLAGRPFLTLTTILTVAVASGLMLLLLTVKDAGFRAFERGAGNMQLIVSRDGSPLVSVLNGIFFAGAPRRPIAWHEYEAIAERYPLEFAIPVQIGDSFRGQPVVATTDAMFAHFAPAGAWSLRDGRFFTESWEVVLGADAARATGLRIGDEIELTHGVGAVPGDGHGDEHGHGHDHDDFGFEVVGVLDATGGPFDRAVFTSLESAWVVHAHDRRMQADPAIHETSADDLTDADRLITGIYLRVLSREGSRLGGGLQQVFTDLRRDPSLTVAQPDHQIRSLFTIVSSIDQLFVALIAVVMISSAIGIMLALYGATEQRRRQIAVLRVLGFTRARIMGLVVTEAALVGALGAVLGVVLSAVGALIVAQLMAQRMGLVIEPAFVSRWTLVVVTATIIMAAGAGVIPALRAYRVPVARNLGAARMKVFWLIIALLVIASGIALFGSPEPEPVPVPRHGPGPGPIPVPGPGNGSGSGNGSGPGNGSGSGQTPTPAIIPSDQAHRTDWTGVNPRDIVQPPKRSRHVTSAPEEIPIPAGSGTDGDPYIVSWDLLLRAQHAYAPRRGLSSIPPEIEALRGSVVRLEGYVLAPWSGERIDELLLMQYAWDGCCIGVPPTAYSSIEVRLDPPASRSQRLGEFIGVIQGRFGIEPFQERDWLLGLYVIDGGVLRP